MSSVDFNSFKVTWSQEVRHNKETWKSQAATGETCPLSSTRNPKNGNRMYSPPRNVCVLELEENPQRGCHENGTKEENKMERRVSASSRNQERKTVADTDGGARNLGSGTADSVLGTDDLGSGTDDAGLGKKGNPCCRSDL